MRLPTCPEQSSSRPAFRSGARRAAAGTSRRTAGAGRRTRPFASSSRRRCRCELAPRDRAARAARRRSPADRAAARLRRADRRDLPLERRAVHPDRLARQLVQCGALRPVPARPRAPCAGCVRDAFALHALRAAAPARRRARDRDLSVGRSPRTWSRWSPRRAGRAGRPSPSPTAPLRRSARPPMRCCKLEAGNEQAVAATKTYVNSLGAVALIFATTTGDAGAFAELRAPARAARGAARPVVARSDRARRLRRHRRRHRRSPAASTTARRSRSP